MGPRHRPATGSARAAGRRGRRIRSRVRGVAAGDLPQPWLRHGVPVSADLRCGGPACFRCGRTAITGLDHVRVAMPAGGEQRARDFYGGLLAMTEVEKPAALAGRGGCWFSAGTAVLHLGVEEPFSPAHKAHPAFLVADLDAL